MAKKLKECGVFGVSSDEYLNYALENRREWAAKGEDVVAKMVAKYAVDEPALAEESKNPKSAVSVATTDPPTEPSSSSHESDAQQQGE